MAYERKTVWYGVPGKWETSASAEQSSRFGTLVAGVPDQSATVLEALLYLTHYGSSSGRGRPSATRVRISVNNGADQSLSWTRLLAVSAPAEMFFGPFDVTSAIRNQLSATMSLSIGFRSQFGNAAQGGPSFLTCWMLMTLAYDDQSPRQVKTVLVPFRPDLALGVHGLAETARTIGIMPALLGSNGMLCEAGATLRQVSVLYSASQQSPAAYSVPARLCLRFPGESSASYSPIPTTGLALHMVPACYVSSLGFDANSDVPFFASVNSASAGLRLLQGSAALGVVTYEFSLVGTTRVLNSTAIPFHAPPRSQWVSTSATPSYSIQVVARTAEPGTLRVVGSGMRVLYNRSRTGINVFSVKVNNAPDQSLSLTLASSNSALNGTPLHWSIDNSSGLGTQISLSYGDTPIALSFQTSTLTLDDHVTAGMLFLNYESNVPSSGIGTATHVLYGGVGGPTFEASETVSALLRGNTTLRARLPSGYVGIHHAALWGALALSSGTANMASTIILDAKPQESSLSGAARLDFAQTQIANLPHSQEVVWPLDSIIKRHRFDESARLALDLERTLTFRSAKGASGDLFGYFMSMMVCYDSVHAEQERTLTGYLGDPSGVEVVTFQRETMRPVWITSANAAGVYVTKVPLRGTFFDYARQMVGRVGASNDYSA